MKRLTGERRALAATVLAFYAFLFFLVSMQPPPGWGTAFGALAAVYGLGFFGLVAGYFWARWYAIGVGMSGFISAVVSMFQIGPEPVLMFYGGTHLFVSMALWGGSMATLFDGRTEWRERFHLDENATHRLGKAVIRVGISLPYIVLYALAPREGAMTEIAALLGLGLAGLGVWALFRLRTWGIVALGGGATALLATLGSGPHIAAFSGGYAIDVLAAGVAGTLLLAAATLPFLGPIGRYLRA